MFLSRERTPGLVYEPRAPEPVPAPARAPATWTAVGGGVRAHTAFASTHGSPSKAVSAPSPASHRTPRPRANLDGSGAGWLLVESELELWLIRSQCLLSFSTASFISLRWMSALGVSVTCAILPSRPIRKLTRRAMSRPVIRTP